MSWPPAQRRGAQLFTVDCARRGLSVTSHHTDTMVIMSNYVCVSVAQIRQQLQAAGAGPTHERRVLRLWSNALPQDSGRRRPEHFLPLSLRAALPEVEDQLQGLARLRSVHPAEDGSE